MFNRNLLCLSVAGILMASAASAQVQASAWTDLNMRAGPGPTYDIIGVIPANAIVDVQGCLVGASWCKVTDNRAEDGAEGWAAGNYLTILVEDAQVALPVAPPTIAIETVTYTANPEEAAAAAGAAGAIAGALIAGPVGAVVGAIAGSTIGVAAVTDPDPQVVAFVQGNPVPTVYLEGEVVVGAAIPEPVTLHAIPNSAYSYIYVNGLPVLVETPSRQVVYIMR